jgi:hypothetical protein
MRILPVALLASMLLLGTPALAQNTPAPTIPSADPTARDSKLAPGGTAAAPAIPSREIPVASLVKKDVMGQDGSDLGDIDRVVERTADKKSYVVVNHGGFLGFFGKLYLLPVEQLAVNGDTVTAANTTQAQLEHATPFVDDPQTYRTIDDNQTIKVLAPR